MTPEAARKLTEDAIGYARGLPHLEIATDEHTNGHTWNDTLHLADRFRLSLYDAAYLELAQRRKLPLATLDQELLNAARAIGTKTLGEP
jgi:predicted nucleic acid-binding protein